LVYLNVVVMLLLGYLHWFWVVVYNSKQGLVRLIFAILGNEMALTKEDLKSIGSLMDDKFVLFEEKINKNTDEKIDSLARITADGFIEVDGKFKKIDERFEKVDDKFKKIDERFEVIDKQLERNEQVHDNISKKLLEHDDKFDNLENQIKQSENRIMGKIDQVLGVVNKLDHERYASISRMDRVQKEIESNKKEIKIVKKVLKIA